MKLLMILLLTAAPCFAGAIDRNQAGTSTQIGTTTFHRYDNGVTGTSVQIGNTSYSRYSDGSSSTSRRIGNTIHTTTEPPQKVRRVRPERRKWNE